MDVGLCALYLLPDQLVLTHATSLPDQKPNFTFLKTSPYQLSTLKTTLLNLVKTHQLKNIPCTWVLHPSYYQLLLLDPPAVQPNEMKEALRWQLKDFIHFPLSEAAVEFFKIPAKFSKKEKLYVAAAHTVPLQAIADIILETGLKLKYIDIAELALRNISALYDDTTTYLGLWVGDEQSTELIITYQGNILLTQRILLQSTRENAMIDIQNGFTYCMSQQQLELPKRLLYALPTPLDVSTTDIDTHSLSLQDKVNLACTPQPENLSYHHLIALGGALRSKDAIH